MTEEHRINIMDDSPATPVASEEKTEAKVEYASIAERFLALLIDYGVIFIPLQFLVHLAFTHVAAFRAGGYLIHSLILINVCFILYETIFSCADRVTLGKSLVGIAVMKEDNSGPISVFRSFLRAIGYYISTALLGCGFFWAFIDDRHRSLHDMLGGSVVVRVRRKSIVEKILLHVTGIVLLLALGYVVYNNVWGGSSWREKLKVTQAREFLVQFSYLEEAHKNLYGAYTTDFLRLVLLSGDPVQFQRDMNKVLSNKGFRIGVKDDKYKIIAHAKDKAKTLVVYEKPF